LPLIKISNAAVRTWVADLLAAELSATTVREAVFALRQCSEAAVADNRLMTDPAERVPLPAERMEPPRYLSQSEVEQLVTAMPERNRALVLVGAYAGVRWGAAAGLTRTSADYVRSRINSTTTAVEIGATVSLGQQPKTMRSKRTVPVARVVMRRIESHPGGSCAAGARSTRVHRLQR